MSSKDSANKAFRKPPKENRTEVRKKTKIAKGGTVRRLPDIRKIQRIGFKQKTKLIRGLEILVEKSI